MKVTHVSLRATEAATAAGRPALTPEMLAATGARYSRSEEGLDAILARVDPENPDKSVDSIFRMVDYGHASIGDMAPVAMFMDGVSILLAYLLWAQCPLAGGQETSTRYVKMGVEGLASADDLGIPFRFQHRWRERMKEAFRAYQDAVSFWENVAAAHPEAMGIPASVLNDQTEAGIKKRDRMLRNYAFDRARYFLPVAAKTNIMMVQSARQWATLCRHLQSHPLAEAQRLGDRIAYELDLVAPRMTKHATFDLYARATIDTDWTGWMEVPDPEQTDGCAPDTPHLRVFKPYPGASNDYALCLTDRTNRYGMIGETLRRTVVQFAWDAVSLAEIRDLNRHRTGNKYCPLYPVGFYCAADQLQGDGADAEYRAFSRVGDAANRDARELLRDGIFEGVYFTLLGSQYPFEHVTMADKFIYEAELRTGTGAHFRYAKHLRDVLALWYESYPDTRGLILEGSGEPE